jgi:hypothetical protein
MDTGIAIPSIMQVVPDIHTGHASRPARRPPLPSRRPSIPSPINRKYDVLRLRRQTLPLHSFVLVKACEIAHSCTHGDAPHMIRACVCKKDNTPEVYKKLVDVVGPKPQNKPMTRSRRQ